MLISNFYDLIISLMNSNIYSIQSNLVSVQQDDTLCQKFNVVAHVIQLAVSRFISNSLAHAYKETDANLPRKSVPPD